jgi:hypothetical protein
MSLSRDSRQEKKLKAIRWAQHRLAQRLQTIDWMEDVLLPEIEALKSGGSVLGLPAGAAFDIQVEHANQGQSPVAAHSEPERAEN